MLITKKSQYSGLEHTVEIPVDKEKYENWELNKRPTLIQREFPELNDSQREFLLTGITEEEWNELFQEEQYSEHIEEITEECDENLIDYSEEFDHE
jgi:hypothetical protein